MPFECVRDKVLCPMDGRCAACTVARLRAQERLLIAQNNRLRGENMALEWGLNQISRHVLKTEDGDLCVAAYAGAVLEKRDADPKLLELLNPAEGVGQSRPRESETRR